MPVVIAEEDVNNSQALALIASSAPEVTIGYIEFNHAFQTELPSSQTDIQWPSWIMPHVKEFDPSIDIAEGFTIPELGQLLTAPVRTEESSSRDLLASFINIIFFQVVYILVRTHAFSTSCISTKWQCRIRPCSILAWLAPQVLLVLVFRFPSPRAEHFNVTHDVSVYSATKFREGNAKVAKIGF